VRGFTTSERNNHHYYHWLEEPITLLPSVRGTITNITIRERNQVRGTITRPVLQLVENPITSGNPLRGNITSFTTGVRNHY
jgi:hypothetical protein